MSGLRLTEAVHIFVLLIDVYCIVHVHCCSNCQARGLELFKFAASSAVHLCSLRQTTLHVKAAKDSKSMQEQ